MTTRTKLPLNCTECGKKLTSRNSARNITGGNDYDDVCMTCYDYWGWENTHADNEHRSDAPDLECPVCVHHGWTDLKTNPSVPTGRHNRSHADCDHARTPAGRAACRKAST